MQKWANEKDIHEERLGLGKTRTRFLFAFRYHGRLRCPRQDLNPRPMDYESTALTN